MNLRDKRPPASALASPTIKPARWKLRYLSLSLPAAPASTDPLSSPDSVFRFMRPLFNPFAEELYVLVLSSPGHALVCHMVAKGTTNVVRATPADVLRLVLLSGGTRFILAHNHPSRDPQPSADDLAFTRRVAQAADLLGVSLIDHVIFTNTDHYSSRRNGLVG